jgi:glutamate/tyrosine decarboxylase-like PLP-dependent enzyme
MSRSVSDYLQEHTTYNPGNYTLEVSRSSSYAMACWTTLKYFGHEGFQAVLGGILEVQHVLRKRIR